MELEGIKLSKTKTKTRNKKLIEIEKQRVEWCWSTTDRDMAGCLSKGTNFQI